MQLQTALTILKQLADGADPSTGEIFPPDSRYQHPQTVRALFTAIDHLDKVQKRQARKRNLPARAGEKWTEEESEKLLTAYNSGTPIRDIAKTHQRTSGAIRSQLQKLGLSLHI